MRFNHFGQKITFIVLLASATALVTITIAFLAVDRMSARSQLQNRLATLADVVGQNSNAALTFNDAKAGNEVLAALQAEPPIVAGCLYDLSARLFASYQRDPGVQTCASNLGARVMLSEDYSSVLRPVTRGSEIVGTLLLTSDLRDLKRRSHRLLSIAGALLLIALLVGVVAGSLMQRKILKPVAELARAMVSVTKDQDYSARVPVAGHDEIGQLGEGFNAMLAELQVREMQQRSAESKLQYQAFNDELTGLPNRRLFADRLGQTLATASRENQLVALLYIDLDGFKLVNDSFGHLVGDVLLREVAARFRSRVRKSDTLARIGGDEFTVALSHIGSQHDALLVANQLLESLRDSFLIEDHKISIGASIGVSLFPENAQDFNVLFQQADSAMYAAKHVGKNGVMFYTPEMGISVCERVNLESQLREAILRGEIHLQYQPEFDITTGVQRLTRFEALARWTHPTLGNIPPSKFIPIAEESGVIFTLAAFLMDMACRDAVSWQRVSANPIQVAVNVSSIQFARPSFVEDVCETLKRTGLPPGLLQLELTESIMLADAERSIATMKRLAGLGVTLAIDDFGTGYSSLSYLQRLPFQVLKIDRSFVQGLDAKPEMRAMVDSLITLAHNLKMSVVAEGVEKPEEMELLKGFGGDVIQGFLLGKPTSDPIEKILETTSKNCQETIPEPAMESL